MVRKWGEVFAIAALWLLWALPVQSAGYPTEDQFRQALNDIDGLVREEGMALDVLDAQKNGLTRPLLSAGLNIDSNSCVVFFNAQPEDGLTQFFENTDERDMPLLLRAMCVHEVTPVSYTHLDVYKRQT